MKELQNKTEKHDHENSLKFPKKDNEYCKKKDKSLNKKKIMLIITEVSVGSRPAISTSTMSIINSSIRIVITSSTAILTCIALLITNENISKAKLRYTNLRDWINFITILYEKTLNHSMIDEKNDQKGTDELKKFFNHYLHKRKKL